MNLEPDGWLSATLGRPCYRVTPDASSASALAAHPIEPRAFFYSKVPVDATSALQALERSGMSVVDVAVTLERAPSLEPPPDVSTTVDIIDCPSAMADEVVAMAAGCFRYSRFHLDPRFSREDANRVKGEWVRNYVLGRRGRALLVALEAGRPAGFLAVLESGTPGHRTHVIDLLGVAPIAQRRGVGRALVAAFVRRYAAASAVLSVGTQIANVPSLKLYGRCGFEIARAAYVLHRHADPTA